MQHATMRKMTVLAGAAPLLLGSALARPTPHLELRSGDSTSEPGNQNDVCTLSVPNIDDGLSYGGFVMPCKQDLTCVSTRLAPKQAYALGDILPIGMCLPKKDSKKDADPCYEFAHQKLRPGFWFDGKQVDCGSGKWCNPEGYKPSKDADEQAVKNALCKAEVAEADVENYSIYRGEEVALGP